MQPKLVVVPSDLPEPPYSEGILARGWTFDLDVDRIDQSDTWNLAPDELKPWLLLLWMRSWSNAPAGTFPANDEVIAARIRMPIAMFRVHREILLRGWVRHSDDRFYHPIVTKMVLRMISKRTIDRVRQAKHQSIAKQSPISEITRDSQRVAETHAIPPPTPKEGQKKKKDVHVLTIADLQHDGLTADLSVEWLEHRKRKKAALTRRAWDSIKAEAKKLDWTPTRAVEKALAKDWRGFEAGWVSKEQTSLPGNGGSRNWGKAPGV